MAAATVNRERRVVQGSKRVVLANVTIAANGDTYNTRLKVIDAYSVDATTNASCGATVAGGVMTFASGGALTMSVIAEGT